MAVELITIPCRADNYAYLLRNALTGETALIDAPEAAPLAAALADLGGRLDWLLLTHHHGDHVDGVADLRAGARVVGAVADAHRLPPLDVTVAPGDVLTICGEPCHVIDAPGHTVGHVAYHFPDSALAFTGDSLMALGCGRLFEGTPAQMWDTLSRLAALPDATRICSGHEYAAANARFALTIEPGNADLTARAARITRLRADGHPTVPVRLTEERATNPFLRAGLPSVKAALGLAGAPDATVFAEIRARKDRF